MQVHNIQNLSIRVDSPLSDARWQCKRDPFSMSCGYVNNPLRASIMVHMDRGALKHYN